MNGGGGISDKFADYSVGTEKSNNVSEQRRTLFKMSSIPSISIRLTSN